MDELLKQIERTRAALAVANLTYDLRMAAFDQAAALCDLAEKELTAAHAMVHDLKEEKLDLCWQFPNAEDEGVGAILGNKEARQAILDHITGGSTGAWPSIRIRVAKALLKEGVYVDGHYIPMAISRLWQELESGGGVR